jgi:iron(III) transport system substrate-binding protein
MRKTILGIAAATLLAGSLAACGGDSEAKSTAKVGGSWDEILELANEEGTVTVYTHMDEPTMQRIEKTFEAEYPEIDAEMVRLTGSEIIPRVDTERRANAGGADAMTTSMPPFLDTIAQDGQLQDLMGPDFIAERDGDLATKPGLATDYYGAHLGGSHIIVWNTDLVKEPITSYQNLLDRADEFEGQVAIPDLYGDVAITFYLGLQKGFDGENVVDPRQSALVTGLAELKPRYYDSATPLTNAVAAGEVKAGLYSVNILVDSLSASGAPIAGAPDPDVPTSINSYAAATGWAEHPNAGQVFVNFLFTKQGQEAQAESGYTSIMSGIKGSPGDINMIAPYPTEVADKEFNTEYISRWKEVFGR